MNKLFKFLYPYSHLHSKWWHRLVLVIVIIGALALTGFSWIRLSESGLPWYTSKLYIKINNYQNNFTEVCTLNTHYKSLRFGYGDYFCNEYSILFQYLKNSDWSKTTLILNNKTFNQIIEERLEVNEARWTRGIKPYKYELDPIEQEEILSNLKTKNIITTEWDSKTNSMNILLFIFRSLGIFIGIIIIFFAIIYRTILYIVYGRSLSNK